MGLVEIPVVIPDDKYWQDYSPVWIDQALSSMRNVVLKFFEPLEPRERSVFDPISLPPYEPIFPLPVGDVDISGDPQYANLIHYLIQSGNSITFAGSKFIPAITFPSDPEFRIPVVPVEVPDEGGDLDTILKWGKKFTVKLITENRKIIADKLGYGKVIDKLDGLGQLGGGGNGVNVKPDIDIDTEMKGIRPTDFNSLIFSLEFSHGKKNKRETD